MSARRASHAGSWYDSDGAWQVLLLKRWQKLGSLGTLVNETHVLNFCLGLCLSIYCYSSIIFCSLDNVSCLRLKHSSWTTKQEQFTSYCNCIVVAGKLVHFMYFATISFGIHDAKCMHVFHSLLFHFGGFRPGKVLESKLESWLTRANVSHSPARAVIAPYPTCCLFDLVISVTFLGYGSPVG